MFRKRPRENNPDGDRPQGDDSQNALVRRQEAAPPAAPAPAKEAVLEFLTGPEKGNSVRLDRIVTLIGRDESCDVVLPDDTVSREHGQIEQTVSQWVYTNFSENGTWINRQKAERVVLSDDDVIEVGRKTRIRFRLQEVHVAEVAQVVRRRPRRTREEIEAEFAQQEDEAPPPTIGETIKKRQRWLLFIGIYLVLIIGAFAFFATREGGGDNADRKLSIYKKETLVRWFENLHYDLPRDDALRNQAIDQAERHAGNAAFGLPSDLFNAIRCYQMAIDYGGGARLDYKNYMQFKECKEKLINELWSYYRDGLVEELDRRNPRAAGAIYQKILDRLPDENAPFVKHVRARIRQL